MLLHFIEVTRADCCVLFAVIGNKDCLNMLQNTLHDINTLKMN